MSVISKPSAKAGIKSRLSSLRKPLEGPLQQLERYLLQQANDFDPVLRDLARSRMASGGKRLRAVLLFYSGWLGEGKGLPEGLIKTAAIIEWVHWATLVHDDILDEADVRHGQPTVSATHGVEAAVLFGDALFAHALRQAADFPTTEVCRVVADTTHRVCSGEMRQTLYSGDTLLSRDAYFETIDLKTAALFTAAARLGAQLSGYDADFIEAAASFGRQLGIAYQICDDLVDFFGREAAIGKTLGTDWQKGKQTLPFILLCERLDNAVCKRLFDQNEEPYSVEALQGLMVQYAIADAVEHVFQNYITAAKQALARFTDRPPTPYLLHLSAFLKHYLRESIIPYSQS